MHGCGSSLAILSLTPPHGTTFLIQRVLTLSSPASYWEISIKISLGRYTLNANYKQFMRQAIVGNGFRFLHISPRHTEQVSTLPFHHRDPFDRLSIAQAMVEGMAIVSNDGNFAPYGVHVIW